MYANDPGTIQRDLDEIVKTASRRSPNSSTGTRGPPAGVPSLFIGGYARALLIKEYECTQRTIVREGEAGSQYASRANV